LPFVQQKITNFATNYVSDKTQTKVEIERLFVTYLGAARIEGLYLEDKNKDTLLYAKSIVVDVAWAPILDGFYKVKNVSLSGLRAKVHNNKDSVFNYEFLIDAFANDSTAKKTESKKAVEDSAKSKKPLPFSIADVKLSDIRANYLDVVSTMDVKLALGKLDMSIEQLLFDSLKFDINSLEVDALKFSYKQVKKATSQEDSTSGKLPTIKVDALSLTDIGINYEAVYDSLFLSASWTDLSLDEAEINLEDQKITAKQLINKQSFFNLQMAAVGSTDEKEDKLEEETTFTLPDWEVSLGTLDFELDRLRLHMGRPKEPVNFDANNLWYDDIALTLDDFTFQTDRIAAELLTFQATHPNQFKLDRLRTKFEFAHNGLSLSDLELSAEQTNLEGDVALNYNSFDQLVAADFNKIKTQLKLRTGTTINLGDVYYFSPDLKNIATYDSLAQSPIKIYGELSGTALKTDVKQLILFYGEQSMIKTSGKVANWMDTDLLAVTLKSVNLEASTSDFSFLIPNDYPARYPQLARIEGSGFYSAERIKADVEALIDSVTTIDLTGQIKLKNKQVYNVDLFANNLTLDKWLQDSINFASTSLSLKANGAGFNWPNLTTDAHLMLPDFSYNDVAFDSLYVDLQIQDDSVRLQSDYEDDKLAYSLNSTGRIDSATQQIALNLLVDKINLKAMKLADTLAYARLSLEADFALKDSSQRLELLIDEMSYADANNTFNFFPLNLKVVNDPDSSYLDFDWEQMQADIQLNQRLEVLGEIKYKSKDILSLQLFDLDSINKPVALAVDVKASLSNNFKTLFSESLSFQPLKFHGEYLSDKKKLDFQLDLPGLSYNGISIDSLMIDISADTTSLSLENTIKKIESGFINIYETSLFAEVNEERADFKLFMLDEMSDSLIFIKANASERNDSLRWAFDSDKFLLNGKDWQMSENNAFYFSENKFRIDQLELSRGRQSLKVATSTYNENTGLSIKFNEFQLQNFISLLNPEDMILQGKIDGFFNVQDYQNPLDFTAEINLDNIKVFDQDGGKLSLNAQQADANIYQVNLKAEGPLSLEGNGQIDNSLEVPGFDIDLERFRLSLPFLSALSDGLVKEASGELQGDFKLSGTAEEFDYSGNLHFKNASLFLTDLNTSFKLPNEDLRLKNNTIHLEKFTILDKQDHKMALTGDIFTENLLNPEIDLKVDAKNFQLINTDADDNDLYYGTIYVDADIDYKGSLTKPDIRADLTINDNTSFTYVVPPSTVDIVEQEGIVRFKTPYEALDSLKINDDSLSQKVEISGIELDAFIKTDKNAEFKVVVDERRGDYLIISGESDLNLNLNKTGTIYLTGNYLVNEGYYQLSLYDLVKRKFEIQPGSQLKWFGDPYEAGLNITANYTVEASPSTLMVDPSTNSQGRTQFRQKVPFIVNLFINGGLSTPEISFGLNMPQDQRGAFGGQVYQQIQSINNNENELNKQVFSLLVLSQFFPRGSSSAGPNSEVLARNSASQILTNQLNKISDQYIKGIDLSLDLDSYQDFESGTAQDRTQLGLNLSKSLFNDRFKVQIGSQVDLEGQQRTEQSAADILGNVLIEYLLTEDGTYKLTGYRKNQFEGLIEGQVVVTGVSVQFNREFEKFRDLWENNNDEGKK